MTEIIYTKRPSGTGEENCRACRWHRTGGRLGMPLPPPHTCGTFETAGQAASRARAAVLARLARTR